MKVILSRKGFDSESGGIINPILPDGTLISLPIPSNDYDEYNNLKYKDIEYSKLIKDLGYKGGRSCHVDPDIRGNIRKNNIEGWNAAFGQIGAAETYLENYHVEVGDIFLFFGRFKKIKMEKDKYTYVRSNHNNFYEGNPIQIIFGYLQVGEILKDPDLIKKYSWHPHASAHRLKDQTNALYIPTEHLSFNNKLSGYGVLNYDKKRILTMEGRTPAKWLPKEFLMPSHVLGNRKNSGKSDELYYAGQWQELVVEESEELNKWVQYIIK